MVSQYVSVDQLVTLMGLFIWFQQQDKKKKQA